MTKFNIFCVCEKTQVRQLSRSYRPTIDSSIERFTDSEEIEVCYELVPISRKRRRQLRQVYGYEWIARSKIKDLSHFDSFFRKLRDAVAGAAEERFSFDERGQPVTRIQWRSHTSPTVRLKSTYHGIPTFLDIYSYQIFFKTP